MIAVGGEALVDLVAEDGVLRPFLGGGPFNTAVALGRLRVPVAFLGRLSDDRFGRLLDVRLAESGVDRRYVLRGAAPTPLAVVQMSTDGVPDFTLYIAGTAYAAIAPADLPELDPGVVAVHVGTLALATDPPATAFETLMDRESSRRLIVVDPNVRPAACGDRDSYRRRFERWAGLAHVIKLSATDAEWLYPGASAESVLDLVLARGARLAVVTLGEHGAVARSPSVHAYASSPRVDVADTVGAGDAFGAGLLCRLWQDGRLEPDAVAAIDVPQLTDALAFATTVAALQCARPGATPPTLDEVESYLREQKEGR
jgi:fructokinase